METALKNENERKKQYLWRYQESKKEIQRVEAQLNELRLNKICPSVNQDGMPKGSGGRDLSAYISKVDELEHKLLKARYRQIQRFKEIRDKIERLPDGSEKDVLTYRYLNGLRWEVICDKMHYSWKQTHRIHSNALKNLQIP